MSVLNTAHRGSPLLGSSAKTDIRVIDIILIDSDALCLRVGAGVRLIEVAKRCAAAVVFAVEKLFGDDTGKAQLAVIGHAAGIALEAGVFRGQHVFTGVVILARVATLAFGAACLEEWVANRKSAKPSIGVFLVVAVDRSADGLGVGAGVLHVQVTKRGAASVVHAIYELIVFGAGKARLAGIDVIALVSLKTRVIRGSVWCTDVAGVDWVTAFALRAGLEERVATRETKVKCIVVGDDTYCVGRCTRRIFRRAVTKRDTVAHIGLGVDVPAHVVEVAVVDATDTATLDRTGVAVLATPGDLDALQSVPRTTAIVRIWHALFALFTVLFVGAALPRCG